MGRSRMSEKREIVCNLPIEEAEMKESYPQSYWREEMRGRFSDAWSRREKRMLTVLEAIKQWCKESQWDYARPQAIRMEDLLEKIMKNFKVTREPAYRRVQRAIQEYECLTADVKEKRKGVYIIYSRERDIQPIGKTTIFYKEPEVSKEILKKVESEKEQGEPIDIYKLLEEASRKHKERQLAKSST